MYYVNNNFVVVLNLDFFFHSVMYCCVSGCCDTSKEMENKGYVPALPPASSRNIIVSMALPKVMNVSCFETQCGSHCIRNVYNGTCCNNPNFACPPHTRCCSNSNSEHSWCCQNNLHCSSMRMICINSAVTTSTDMLSMLFAFMIGVVSKYFL